MLKGVSQLGGERMGEEGRDLGGGSWRGGEGLGGGGEFLTQRPIDIA